MPTKRLTTRRITELATKLNNVRHELFEAGLVESAQLMDAVIKKIGWEGAEKLEEKWSKSRERNKTALHV